MQGLPRGRARSVWAAAIGAALLVALVSACSSSEPEREYATPKELCGTEVSATSLEPLLPPGKEDRGQARVGGRREALSA